MSAGCDECVELAGFSVTAHEKRVQEFALAVYRYCLAVHGSVTSWYRTPERNKAKGGVPGSKHLIGLGADIGFDPAPRLQPHERAALAVGFGLRLIVEGTHDHVQAR